MAAIAAILAGVTTPASAASGDSLAVVSVGSEAPSFGAADWSEVLPVRAELGGGKFLVELDPPARRTLRDLAARVDVLDSVSSTHVLYRVVGAGGVERAMMPRMGRVLWGDGEQALLDAERESDVWALAGDGVKIYKVPSHPILAASRADESFAAPDYPIVDEIVAKVLAAHLSSFDQDLVDFGTRHSNQPGGTSAQAYLVQKFQSFGLTQIEQTAVPNISAKNVCATLPGTTTPEKILVIGGHYDSTTNNPANAPGADDDGSGTSGMLEAASILSQYHFQSTLVFCGYAGEELGLLGSSVHAQSLKAANANVTGMINLDMIGYLEPGDAVDIDVLANGSSATMRTLFSDVVARYLPGAIEVTGQIPQGASSDHASYWQEGYPALLLFEDTGNDSPYIHTASDTVGTSFNSPALAEEITRGATALLAVMAVPDTAAPAGTPTPGASPTPTPGSPADGGTIHGSCACDLSALGAAPSALCPAILALAALAFRRRNA